MVELCNQGLGEGGRNSRTVGIYYYFFYNLIAHDKLNLCDMHREGSKKRLRTAVLKTVSEYYGVCTYGRVENTDPQSADYPLTPTPRTTLRTTPRTTPADYPK